jgi:hypothetical protein
MKIALGLACLLATTAAAAHGATIGASAGLGGVAKAGRWTPLTVTVAGDGGESVDAELQIAWGDARLRRPVTVASGARKEFELYLRTTDARGAIDVRLVAGGRTLATATAPVRVLGFDDPVVLCVKPDAASPDGGSCTASVLARELPRSVRGYEVADSVEWPGGRVALVAEQDAALRAWQSLEALDASGDLGLTPQVSRPQLARGLPSSLAPAIAGVSTGYLIALVAMAFALRARRARLASTAAGFAAITAAACAAVAGIGRIGPTRAVHLHHVSLLQQLPGTGDAVLTMRGIAEFPAFDRFALRLPASDATLETTSPRGGAEGQLDADGFPVVSGVFGTGGRQSFAGEALVPAQPLAVAERGNTVEIENRSGRPLRDCRFGAGLDAAPVARLEPGARLAAAWTSGSGDSPGGPLLTCLADDATLPLTEAQRPVVMHGITTIAVYRGAARGTGGE